MSESVRQLEHAASVAAFNTVKIKFVSLHQGTMLPLFMKTVVDYESLKAVSG